MDSQTMQVWIPTDAAAWLGQHAGGVGIPAILFGSGAAIPSEHPDLGTHRLCRWPNLRPGMPPAPPQQGKTIKP